MMLAYSSDRSEDTEWGVEVSQESAIVSNGQKDSPGGMAISAEVAT